MALSVEADRRVPCPWRVPGYNGQVARATGPPDGLSLHSGRVSTRGCLRPAAEDLRGQRRAMLAPTSSSGCGRPVWTVQHWGDFTVGSQVGRSLELVESLRIRGLHDPNCEHEGDLHWVESDLGRTLNETRANSPTPWMVNQPCLVVATVRAVLSRRRTAPTRIARWVRPSNEPLHRPGIVTRSSRHGSEPSRDTVKSPERHDCLILVLAARASEQGSLLGLPLLRTRRQDSVERCALRLCRVRVSHTMPNRQFQALPYFSASSGTGECLDE